LLQVRTSWWFCGVFRTIFQLWQQSQGCQSLLDLVASLINLPLRQVEVMTNVPRVLPLDHGMSTKGIQILLKMFNSAHQGRSCNLNQMCLAKQSCIFHLCNYYLPFSRHFLQISIVILFSIFQEKRISTSVTLRSSLNFYSLWFALILSISLSSAQEFCSVGDDSCLVLWDARAGCSPVVKVTFLLSMLWFHSFPLAR